MKEQLVFIKVFKKEEIVTFENFKKTPQEKEALKLAKYKWRDAMRAKHPKFTAKKGFKFSQSF